MLSQHAIANCTRNSPQSNYLTLRHKFCRFNIEEKLDNSLLHKFSRPFMTALAHFLNLPLYNEIDFLDFDFKLFKRNIIHTNFIDVDSKEDLKRIIKYFDTYPLYSIKLKEYKKFRDFFISNFLF
jgi:hypothetical protein